MITDPEANTEGRDTDNETEMTFLEHLEELRWRIIKSAAGIIIGGIIAGILTIGNDFIKLLLFIFDRTFNRL